MNTIIPQPNSLMDMDDWYNFDLSTAGMAEPVEYSSNPMASYCQSNAADFTQSQYLANQGAQGPWDTIDSSLFHQKNPMDSTTAANTSFPQYVPETSQSYSQNNLLGGYACEDEVANSVSSYDYKLPDLEPSLSDSSACSEVEDCATTRITLRQTLQNSTNTRRQSREKRANKSRKATAKTAMAPNQTTPYRISKYKRTTSSSSDSEDIDRTTLAKQTHSEIERKYRNNLNEKMWQLHRTLESTSRMSSSTGSSDDSDSSQQAQQQQQPRKSDILSNALQYIDESELEMRHMSDEIHRLKNRLAALQRMVRCEGDCDALKQIVKMKMAT